MNNSSSISVESLYAHASKPAHYSIDSSNRVMLPSEWRIEGAPDRFFVFVASSKDHLKCYPPKAFEERLKKLRDGTADERKIAMYERELSDRVRQVALDRFGRLPLPREFTEKTGIKKRVEMVGRFSMFEIWECDQQEQERIARQEIAVEVEESFLNR